MFVAGTEFFIHFASTGKTSMLNPVKVDRVEEGVSYVFFVGEFPPFEAAVEGAEAVIFFHGPKEFMQQPAVVTEVIDDNGKTFFGIQTTGDAVSAESRKCYRVCTVLGSYEATIGDEGRRHIVDVSATGLAVMADGDYAFGQVLPVSFELNGKTYSGAACVQSVKKVKAGTRYGLLCVECGNKDNLEDGLQKLTMDAQRTQLKRLSGAA